MDDSDEERDQPTTQQELLEQSKELLDQLRDNPGDRDHDREGLNVFARSVLDGFELLSRSIVMALRRDGDHPDIIVEAAKNQIADEDPESLYNLAPIEEDDEDDHEGDEEADPS